MAFAPSHKPDSKTKYTFIIPAAGVGKRMKIYGPKSLVQINDGSTIISRQIELIYSTYKNCEIIVIGGFQCSKLGKELPNAIKFVINENYEKTNVLKSISIGLSQTDNDKVLIINGDLIFNKECINLPFYENSSIVISDTMKKEEVGCIVENNKLQNIFYQLPQKWAQISFFTGKELEILRNIAFEKKKESWFTFEAINEIINLGGNFHTFHPKNAKAIDIDSSYDLKKIHETFN